jgi:hypothetical protein
VKFPPGLVLGITLLTFGLSCAATSRPQVSEPQPRVRPNVKREVKRVEPAPPPGAPAEREEKEDVKARFSSPPLEKITSVRLEWLALPVDQTEDLSLTVGEGGDVWVAGHNSAVSAERDFFVGQLSGAEGQLQQFNEGTGRFVRDLDSSASGTYLLTEFMGRVRVGEYAVSSRGATDVFLGRLGPSGALAWGQTFGTSTFDRAYRVLGAPSGGAFVLSSHLASLEHGGQKVEARGREDTVLTRWSDEGQLVWGLNLGTSRVDRGRSLTLGPRGEVVVGGTRYATDLLGPDAQASASSRGFVARVSLSGELLEVKELGNPGEHVEVDLVEAAHDGEHIAVSGQFYERAHLGRVQIEAQPGKKQKMSSFVALLSAEGDVLWARPSPKIRCWLGVRSDVLIGATSEGIVRIGREGEPEWLSVWDHHEFFQVSDCERGAAAWYVSGFTSSSTRFMDQEFPTPMVQRFRAGTLASARTRAFVAKFVPEERRVQAGETE